MMGESWNLPPKRRVDSLPLERASDMCVGTRRRKAAAMNHRRRGSAITARGR